MPVIEVPADAPLIDVPADIVDGAPDPDDKAFNQTPVSNPVTDIATRLESNMRETLNLQTASRFSAYVTLTAGGRSFENRAVQINDPVTKRASIEQTTNAPGHPTKVIFVVDGDDLYVSGEGLTDLPANTEWLRYDLAELGLTRQVLFERFSQTLDSGKSNITDAAGVLLRSSQLGDFGARLVHGVRAHGYGGPVDVKKALQGFTEKRLTPAVRFDGAGTMFQEIWVDGDGHVRHWEWRVESPAGRLVMGIDLLKEGEGTDVTLPPITKVLDVTNLPPEARRTLRQRFGFPGE